MTQPLLPHDITPLPLLAWSPGPLLWVLAALAALVVFYYAAKQIFLPSRTSALSPLELVKAEISLTLSRPELNRIELERIVALIKQGLSCTPDSACRLIAFDAALNQLESLAYAPQSDFDGARELVQEILKRIDELATEATKETPRRFSSA